MKNYEELDGYDLLAKVYLIKTEYGGRQGALLDGYRGQFFWHINDVSCSDWDARYYFADGSVGPGEESLCKILLSENVLKSSNGLFPEQQQFGIREGSRIMAVGVILESNVKNA